jgi:hypothetical protein
MAYCLTETNERIDITEKIDLSMISPLRERTNTYSMPFAIYSSPEIDILFGRASHIEARDNKIRELNVVMVMDILRLRGVLRVLSIKNGFYECIFIGQNSVNYRLSQVKLAEIDLGLADLSTFFDIDINEYAEHIISVDGLKAICFPPLTNYLITDKFAFYAPVAPIVNFFQYDTVHQDGGTYIGIGDIRFAPAIFINYVLNKIFESVGLEISENALNESPFTDLAFVSNNLIGDFAFAEYTSSSYEYSISNIVVDDTSAIISLVHKNMSIINENGFIKLYNLTIDEAQNFEGRVVQIEKIDFVEYALEIKINEGELSSATGSLGKIRIMYLSVTQPESINIADHMPDMTALEFIEAVEKQTGTIMVPNEIRNNVRFIKLDNIIMDKSYVDVTQFSGKLEDVKLNENDGYAISYTGTSDEYYDERVLEISDKHQLKDSVASQVDLPMFDNDNGDVRLVIDENMYYAWETANYGSRQVNTASSIYIGSWKTYSENFIKKSEGNEDYTIEINTKPVISGPAHYFSAGFNIPRIDIAYNNLVATERTETGIRTLFFGELTNYFPLATTETDELSLKIFGDTGLYEKLYKNFLHWRLDRYREAKTIICFPYHLFTTFKWDKKYKINGTDYLIMDIQLSQEGNKAIVFGETFIARV